MVHLKIKEMKTPFEARLRRQLGLFRVRLSFNPIAFSISKLSGQGRRTAIRSAAGRRPNRPHHDRGGIWLQRIRRIVLLPVGQQPALRPERQRPDRQSASRDVLYDDLWGGGCYLFSFQVTPSLVSFTSKPAAERASRIWSLTAQFFSALALARSSSTMSTTLP